jgi:two-component system response regulator PilR (NtrC family)
MSTHGVSGPRAVAGAALVVDDDPVLAAAIVEFLNDLGFIARAVNTVAAAREQFRTWAFDVLVLDLTLPDEFGGDLLGELAETPRPPITVLVSGFALASIIARRHDVPLLTKPFALEALSDAIASARRDSRRPRKAATR